MLSNYLKDFAGGIVRHLLTGAGGYLATHGYLAADDQNALIGSGLFLFGLAWSLAEKIIKK